MYVDVQLQAMWSTVGASQMTGAPAIRRPRHSPTRATVYTDIFSRT